MTFYYDRVKDGSVKSSMVLAVPRSVSSALSKALSNSPDFDFFLFQPFSLSQDRKQELEKPIADQNPSPDAPMRVLMKVMAESLTGQRFHHLKNHTDGICVLVRDPQSQALSAFRARHNRRSGQAKQDEELKKLKHMTGYDYLKDFIVTPWERMEVHVQQLSNQDRTNPSSPKWCAVDGDVIRALPDKMLHRICSELDITYTGRMLNDWQNKDEITHGLKVGYGKSWLGRAQQSKGLKPPAAMTPTLEDFSAPVRQQIVENLKVYVHVLASQHALRLSPNELRHAIREKRFAHTSPIACYTMAAVIPEGHDHTKSNLLAYIREQEPSYHSSYDIIDQELARMKAGHERSTTPPHYQPARIGKASGF